jgi:lysozyme
LSTSIYRYGGFLLAAILVGGCGSSTEDPVCIASTRHELRVCAAGPTVQGIDVSKYQRYVDWDLVKGAGKVFGIARASDGLNYNDMFFERNWNEMKRVGIIRGVYQYFRASQDPIRQANFMLDKVGDAGGFAPGDLPAVLDLETKDGQEVSVVVDRAKRWLDHVERETGVRPIVYSANFMSSVVGTNFSAYPLWVANYTTQCPLMPTGWTNWVMWQNSGSGTVPGVSGNCDTDYFNGTLADLRAFVGLDADGGVLPRPDGGAIPRPDAGNASPDSGATPSRDAGTPDAGGGGPLYPLDAGDDRAGGNYTRLCH